jgi:uncharacterized protein (DUF608 family)
MNAIATKAQPRWLRPSIAQKRKSLKGGAGRKPWLDKVGNRMRVECMYVCMYVCMYISNVLYDGGTSMLLKVAQIPTTMYKYRTT